MLLFEGVSASMLHLSGGLSRDRRLQGRAPPACPALLWRLAMSLLMMALRQLSGRGSHRELSCPATTPFPSVSQKSFNIRCPDSFTAYCNIRWYSGRCDRLGSGFRGMLFSSSYGQGYHGTSSESPLASGIWCFLDKWIGTASRRSGRLVRFVLPMDGRCVRELLGLSWLFFFSFLFSWHQG